MNHELIRPLLDDYLDGELAPAARMRVEDHLRACEACTAELASLTELVGQARGLPPELLPRRDLWEGIEARLAAPRTGVLRLPRGGASRVRPWMMAAAALLLVVASSSVTLLLVRSGATGPEGPAVAPWRAPEGSALAAFEPTEAEYVRTAGELREALAVGGSFLQPETVAAVERSLAIIDQAIAEARAALEEDPNNHALVHLLSGIHREKVELLQRTLQFEARS